MAETTAATPTNTDAASNTGAAPDPKGANATGATAQPSGSTGSTSASSQPYADAASRKPSVAEVARASRERRAKEQSLEAEARAAKEQLAKFAPLLEAIEKDDYAGLLKLRGKSLVDLFDQIAESGKEPTTEELTHKAVQDALTKREQEAAARAKSEEDAAFEATKTKAAKTLRDSLAKDRVAGRTPQVFGHDLVEEAVELSVKSYMEADDPDVEYIPPAKALEMLENRARVQALEVLGLTEDDVKRLSEAATQNQSGKAATPVLNSRTAAGPTSSAEGDDEPALGASGGLKAAVERAARKAFKDRPDVLSALR